MARIALTGAVSNDDLAQYTTAPVTAPAKALILAWVANTGPSSEPTVSGSNVTFTRVATIAVPGGTNRRLSCLRAMSDTGFSGPLNITFGTTQLACAWAIHAYTEVDTTGINGEGAIGAPPTTKTSAADTMHSVALSSPPAPRSVVAGALMTRYSRAITPGAGLTEINVQSMAGDYGTLDTVDRSDGQQSAAWSWTPNSESASILFEIKARPVAQPQPVPTTTTDRDLAKRFEPIMVMHPNEIFRPADAKRYVEHCALWRAEGPFDVNSSWGGATGAPFDRKPEIAKGKIKAIVGELEPGDALVNLPGGLGGPRERFLELAGWRNRSGGDEPAVTAQSRNNYAHRDAIDKLYNFVLPEGGDQDLQDSRFWYHAEVFRTDKLRAVLPMVAAPDLVKVLDILDNPVLLNYYFFFPIHDEPLDPPCNDIFAREFGGFGGEWQCLSILLEGGDNLVPTFIGVTGRPTAMVPPRTAVRINDDDPAGRLVMRVSPFDEAESIAAPGRTMTVLFAAKGTHSLYLREGTIQTTYPKDEGPISCGFHEGPLRPVAPGDSDPWAVDAGKLVAKVLFGLGLLGPIGAFIGYVMALIELSDEFGFSVTGSHTADPPPPDSTAATRMDALIIKPDLNLVDFGPDQRKWAVQEMSDGNRRYDFMVDRDKQLWWPSYNGESGFRGRWGPRVEKDPFDRRAGVRFPAFWAMFFRALAAGRDAKVF